MAMWSCSVTCMTTKWCLCPFTTIITLNIIFFAILGLVLSIQGRFSNADYISDSCDKINNGQLNQTDLLGQYALSFVKDVDS